jgi:hypothetical protein
MARGFIQSVTSIHPSIHPSIHSFRHSAESLILY